MRRTVRGGWGIVLLPLLAGAAALAFIAVSRNERTEVPRGKAPESVAAEMSAVRVPPSREGHYELWERRAEGGETRLGAFRVLAGGSVIQLSGEPLSSLPLSELPSPEAEVLLTLESGENPVRERSERVVLRGVVRATDIALTPVVPAVPKKRVAILAAPGGGPETSGVWFADTPPKTGNPPPGLSLGPPPHGWIYGAWVMTGAGTPLFLGSFQEPKGPDSDAAYSSRKSWNVPGEEFARNAPEGVTFPLNVADGRTEVLISLEPDFFTIRDAGPFLPILSTRIPFGQKPRTPFSLQGSTKEKLPFLQLRLHPSGEPASGV
jgi:hypothetical protein